MGFLSIYAALCCIALRVRAVVVQDDWVFPQGPDKSSTLDLDDPYTVQWTTNLQSWFPKYAPNANTSNLDLWVTGEHTVLGYHKLMGKSHLPHCIQHIVDYRTRKFRGSILIMT